MAKCRKGGSVRAKAIKTAERKANVLRKERPRTPSRKKIITGQIKAKIAIEALKGIKTNASKLPTLQNIVRIIAST